jgi:S-DNA-T family DNA segregation ATPase FtsK/SpoIIIE
LQAKTVFSLSGPQRLVEVGLIACLGLATFLLLALLSFDPADPSWSQTGYHTDIRNIAGPIGAETADVLFWVFGWLSYLVPPFIAFCGYLVFRRFKDLLSIDYFVLGLRLLGLLLTIIAACAISSINFNDFFMYSSGGVVGDVTVALLLPQLHFAGTSLLLLCVFCIGLTLMTGISWLTVADSLGDWVLSAVRALANWPQTWLRLTQRNQNDQPAATAAATVQLRSTDKTKAVSDNQYPASASDKTIPQGLATGHVSPASASAQTPAGELVELPVSEPTFDLSALDAVAEDRPVTAPLPAEPAFSVTVTAGRRAESLQSPVFKAELDAPLPAERVTVAVPPPEAVYSNPFKIDPSVQSRGYFNERVEPLPIAPLDIKTEARAFVSIDEVADDDLSYRTVDDTYADDEIAQGFLHTQASQQTAVDDDDFDDEPPRYSPADTRPPVDQLPSISLLERANRSVDPISAEDLEKVSRLVEVKLLDFGVDAKVVGVHPGPVVTRFELDLAPGVKVSKITGLSKDLARSLSAISVRVVEVIPGKSFIGLELPNQQREIVRLSEVIGDEIFTESKSPLTMVLGKDIAGKAVVADLAKMPHLLVAGTTGSGKSVGVNVMICSLLYKSTPEDVRFLMIDPKMLELSVYEGIPHLLTEVVTDMKEAANGLRWCVGEMERRYKLMSALGVRNLKGYNVKVAEAIADGKPLKDPLWRPADDMRTEPPLLEKLPSIVVVIDEFADMMMIVGKKVEELIARIAQKARAAGIHLILATQRPSVDVITGLIKANIPTRIAFQVSSKIDSRTILDQQGAESLLGQGDMLYLPPGSGVPNRVHGAFVDDHEVHAVVADWKTRGKPNYIPDILSGETSEDSLLPGETMEDEDAETDPLFDQAVAFVTESRKASVSGVQRRFRIGYNRAARLVETMEQIGIVSGPGHNGNREVLVPPPPKGF